LGLGAEYATKNKDKLLIYLLYSKITMVSDQRLANQGALVLKKPCSIWMEI
jgi:hypothetical protein